MAKPARLWQALFISREIVGRSIVSGRAGERRRSGFFLGWSHGWRSGVDLDFLGALLLLNRIV